MLQSTCPPHSPPLNPNVLHIYPTFNPQAILTCYTTNPYTIKVAPDKPTQTHPSFHPHLPHLPLHPLKIDPKHTLPIPPKRIPQPKTPQPHHHPLLHQPLPLLPPHLHQTIHHLFRQRRTAHHLLHYLANLPTQQLIKHMQSFCTE